MAPRRPDIGLTAQLAAYAIPLAVAALLASTLLLGPRIRLFVVLTTLPVALVLFPLEILLSTPGSRLERAFIRRSQLPVLNRDGVDIYPVLAPWDLAYGRRTLTVDDGELLPLTGFSKRETGLCVASDAELVFESDEAGFRNPRGLNDSTIDVAIIGDSFAQGYCLADSLSVAGRVRSRFPSTVNFGTTGAGPVWELGILREYAALRRPRVVVWMFFEGNDLESTGVERSGFASKYLQPEFTQRLRDRQPEIESALAQRLDSLAESFRPGLVERLRRLVLFREARARLALSFRSPEAAIPRSGTRVDDDIDALGELLDLAAREVSAWGGTVVFVYLPERPRYSAEIRSIPEAERPGHYAARVRVVTAAKTAQMEVLDMVPPFDALPDALAFWDDGKVHYNAAGYALIADSVVALLEREPWRSKVRTAVAGSTAKRPAADRWIPFESLDAASIRKTR